MIEFVRFLMVMITFAMCLTVLWHDGKTVKMAPTATKLGKNWISFH